MRAEYSTDPTLRADNVRSTTYEAIARPAVLAAKAKQVSFFLGKKVTPQLTQEIGIRLSIRIEGTYPKHPTSSYTTSFSGCYALKPRPMTFLSLHTTALRVFGLIKRIAESNRYYLTFAVRAAIAIGEKST